MLRMLPSTPSKTRAPVDSSVRPMIAALLAALTLAGCSAATDPDVADAARIADTQTEEPTSVAESGSFLDAAALHEISVTFDEDEYDAMVAAYRETGEKEWIAADIDIDGVTYANAGIRLKGNSSLRGLSSNGRTGGESSSADEPESLPWLIRLDKYIDGQSIDGVTELVVRANNTETSLNEAVALTLLDLAGLASQDAAYAAFTVNGSAETLRLVVEHPDDVWLRDAVADDTVLYKAESTGDYTYRGTDPDAYDEVFDVEAGEDNGDLAPLIEFLDFINNADDETFDAELSDRLDIEAFATYLAMEELIDNFDDIDGPGNNSYLAFGVQTGVFTIVPWDHNLAFGAPGVGDGAAGRAGPGGRGDDAGDERPPPGGGPDPRDGGPSQSNVLVERFLANGDWRAMYDAALERLEAELYSSGVADEVLQTWTRLLTTTASDLVAASVVADEAATISAYFS